MGGPVDGGSAMKKPRSAWAERGFFMRLCGRCYWRSCGPALMIDSGTSNFLKFSTN